MTVERPLRVVEQTFRTDDGTTFENRFATFAATPTAADPALADDPGEASEGIERVAWHRSVTDGIQQATVPAGFVDG